MRPGREIPRQSYYNRIAKVIHKISTDKLKKYMRDVDALVLY